MIKLFTYQHWLEDRDTIGGINIRTRSGRKIVFIDVNEQIVENLVVN